MEQVGTVKKYRDGAWYIWVDEGSIIVVVYLQRMGYFVVEYAFSVYRIEWDGAENKYAFLNGPDMLLAAKERYKAKWLDDDEEI